MIRYKSRLFSAFPQGYSHIKTDFFRPIHTFPHCPHKNVYLSTLSTGNPLLIHIIHAMHNSPKKSYPHIIVEKVFKPVYVTPSQIFTCGGQVEIKKSPSFLEGPIHYIILYPNQGLHSEKVPPEYLFQT
jgi:hypothetical protein